MRKHAYSLFALAVFTMVPLAQADTLAKWTFESSEPQGTTVGGTWRTNVLAEIGTGTASAYHSDFMWYVPAPGNGSANAFGATNLWTVGDLLQFAVSTKGHQAVSVSYDQIGSSPWVTNFFLAYSTDGTTFTKVGSDYSVTVGTWSSTTVNTSSSHVFDLSSITGLNDQTTVYFRVVDDTGVPNTFYADDNRIDNFLVSAQLIPEPSVLNLAFLGGACTLFRLARRRHTAA